MTFTTEQIRELVPEEELKIDVSWTLGNQEANQLGDYCEKLFNALLETRHRLKVARDGLERADSIARSYVSNDAASEIRRVTTRTLEATK